MLYQDPPIKHIWSPVTQSRLWRCFLTILFGCAFFPVLSLLGATTSVADTKTIGIVIRSWDQGRFTDLLVPVIEEAAVTAGYHVVVRNSQDSTAQQAADVASLVAQGVEGIVVGLVNGDAADEVGAAAANSGTPLVFMNVSPKNVMHLPSRQAYVGPDEYDVGRAQALAVCSVLGEGGRVGLLIGNLLHPAAAARAKAVRDTIRSDACEGVTLVYEETAEWDRRFAEEVTNDWIADGLRLDAVIANNDPMGLGALDAFKKRGIDLDTVFVTGVDGSPEAIEAILDGTLDLTFLQDVEIQGQEIFATLMRIAAGDQQEKEVLLPLTPITQAECDESCQHLTDRPKL